MKNETVFCKHCKYRKDKFCIVKEMYVPRKGTCDKAMKDTK